MAAYIQRDGLRDEITELACNLDDMTPEGIGFAMETLLSEGALDVFTTAIGMKKSRPGVMLTVLCRPGDAERMARLIFKHTTTLGIRESTCQRYTLERSFTRADTPYGPVQVKRVEGWGTAREKAEYEDLARIAREKGISINEVRKHIK